VGRARDPGDRLPVSRIEREEAPGDPGRGGAEQSPRKQPDLEHDHGVEGQVHRMEGERVAAPEPVLPALPAHPERTVEEPGMPGLSGRVAVEGPAEALELV